MALIIYTLKNCPQCVQLKKEMKKRGIKFIEKNMESPEARTTLLINSIFTTVAPVLQNGKSFYISEQLFGADGILEIALSGVGELP
ncbi:MAG: glutaredoxin domain-containing protein [Candidatus Methanoperedens sp.]